MPFDALSSPAQAPVLSTLLRDLPRPYHPPDIKLGWMLPRESLPRCAVAPLKATPLHANHAKNATPACFSLFLAQCYRSW